MAQLSTRQVTAQEGMGAAAYALPTGNFLFVDSNRGADGNSGADPSHPLKTLTRALALAVAGDTIILGPGGSETVTSTLGVSVARLKIVCPAENRRSLFEVTGAASLDLMTVTASDVQIEGLQFTRTAGAGQATAMILTSADADRITIKRCLFDYSDCTSSWIGYGVELTNDLLHPLIVDCEFVDCHRGVIFPIATGKNQVGGEIRNCVFWVGQATAFGIYCDPTSTGTSMGLRIIGNEFREQKGSGAAGEAWDGTNDTNATKGPYLLGALCDRVTSAYNFAHTVLDQAFDTLNNVNAGCAIEKIMNKTSTDSDEASAILSVGVATSTDTKSVGTAASTDTKSVGTLVASVGTAASTDTLSVGTLATSVGTVASAAKVAASTDTKSVGTLVSALGTTSLATSAALSTQVLATSTDIKSVGVLASTDTKSVGTLVSTDIAATGSVGTLVSSDRVEVASVGTLVSTDRVEVASVGTLVSTDRVEVGSVGTLVSTDIVATGSVGTLVSTDRVEVGSVGILVSTDIVATGSVGTLVSTDIVATTSVGTLVSTDIVATTGKGSGFCETKVIASSSLPNNTSTYALWTATGDVWIEDILFEKDASNMTGPTNVVMRTNNTYGPTGNGTNVFSNVLAGFNANLKLLASAGGVTPMTQFMLENGASIYIAGDDQIGAGGNLQVTVKARRVTNGASLA